MINQVKNVIVLFVFALISMPANAQGLQFSSVDNLIADRTAYKVFSESAQSFPDLAEITFDLSIINPNLFGYILSINDQNNDIRYNLSYNGDKSDTAILIFSAHNKLPLFKIPVSKNDLGPNRWSEVTIALNKNTSEVSLKLNGKKNNLFFPFTSRFLIAILGKSMKLSCLPKNNSRHIF